MAKRVVWGSCVIGAVFAASIVCWVLAQYGGLESSWVVLNPGESVYRVKALMFEPNLLGSLGALWIGVAFYWRRAFSPSLLWALTTLISAGVFLTFTRAAWVAVIVTGCVALAKSRHLVVRIPLLVGAASVVIVGLSGTNLFGALNLGTTLSQRLSGIFDFGSGTGAYRVSSWEIALSQLSTREAWFFGLGANSFSQRNLAGDTSTGEAYLGNFWLALLYDSGILGLLLVILGLLFVWKTSPRPLDALPVFVTIVVTASVTSPMWFAYPWIALAMISVQDSVAADSQVRQNVFRRGRSGQQVVGAGRAARITVQDGRN